MVVKEEERREEEHELDRRIDLINVVFGAALGGYIGAEYLDATRVLVLSVALIILVCLLVAIRGDTYLDFSSLAPVPIGWIAALAVVLSAHLLMLREARRDVEAGPK
jgi:NADH:ubiquinone oxidoreductase subunit 6 (subunit J)